MQTYLANNGSLQQIGANQRNTQSIPSQWQNQNCSPSSMLSNICKGIPSSCSLFQHVPAIEFTNISNLSCHKFVTFKYNCTGNIRNCNIWLSFFCLFSFGDVTKVDDVKSTQWYSPSKNEQLSPILHLNAQAKQRQNYCRHPHTGEIYFNAKAA